MTLDKLEQEYKELNEYIKNKSKYSLYEIALIAGCIFVAVLMVIRCFFGTEITDEAYYVADALEMIRGNIPYAYNNYSMGTGSAFLLIPIVYIYKLFFPDLAGVFLYTRLCYIVFRFAILGIVYRILRKRIPRAHALLLIGIMIPYVGSIVGNFNYNTVATMLSFLVVFLLFDAIENKSNYKTAELIISGFLMGIAIFAHPGYGLALIVFLILIPIREQGSDRIVSLLKFCIGGIAEIAVVFIPIIAQVGVDALWAGIRLYFKSYPSMPLAGVEEVSRFYGLKSVYRAGKPMGIIALAFFVLVLFLGYRYIREQEKKLDKSSYMMLGVVSGIIANLLVLTAYLKEDMDSFYYAGILAAGYAVFLILLRKCNVYFGYLAIYPILFPIAEILVVSAGSNYTRFYYSVPIFFTIFIVLFEDKSEIVRVLTAVAAIMIIIIFVLSDFLYVYRDEKISHLKYKVQEGIYKGIYTTKDRMRDLPELENYLNSMIAETESYAFRDNVPCGYLMTHQGEMCDIATWDCLNYSYDRNAPALLFDYYKRRQDIPDKIIYIDYGRDDNLSIDDSEFFYNTFVNEYYTLIDDRELNDTFYRVMVFEYTGGFDENYDDLLNKYVKMQMGEGL